MSMLQIKLDDVIAEDFRQLAKDNQISQRALFEFLLMQFLRSGSAQVRAGALKRIERKKS